MPVTNSGSIIKPGKIAHFAQSAAPEGWLKANGAAVSRTTYAALFLAIGTVYGVGDGATTFNLPDLRGEFMRGLDDGRGVDAARALGSMQMDEMKSHSHIQGGNVWTTTNANPGITPGALSTGGRFSSGTGTDNTGGAETRPRNVALLACIKY